MRKIILLGCMLGSISLASPSAWAQNGAMYNQTIAGTRLDISATGDVKAVPDIAIISAGVVTQNAEAATAMADNANKMKAAVAALKRAGVADKDVQSLSLNLQPQYRYNNNEPPVLTGYQASNQITIRFRDIARAGAVIDALVKQGINQINGPTLTIDKPETMTDTARTKALASARSRAELYAKAAGMRVKRIVAISESSGDFGGPQPMMMRANMVADAASTPIAPGEQTISVSVNVTFELE
jgi:uncharacterized protein